jgi:hypothetical protein
MTTDDLEKESRIPTPEPEHDFDERLYVIKLPMPIPTEEYSPVPQFLFIRADELVLFDCFGRNRWSILIGNPGISKSWFHWKFILLCYRQDLYQQLRSNEAEEAGLVCPEKQSLRDRWDRRWTFTTCHFFQTSLFEP